MDIFQHYANLWGVTREQAKGCVHSYVYSRGDVLEPVITRKDYPMSAEYEYEEAKANYERAYLEYTEALKVYRAADQRAKSRFPDQPKDGTVLKFREGRLHRDPINVAYRDGQVWRLTGVGVASSRSLSWETLSREIGNNECWILGVSTQVKKNTKNVESYA